MKLSSSIMFPFAMQIPYKLHSVMVHEGSARFGHYWCYVKQKSDHTHPGDPVTSQWFRYNDTDVTSATTDKLQKESFGVSDTSSSAYCLVYVDQSSNEVFGEWNRSRSFISFINSRNFEQMTTICLWSC